ncbi:hypothetical protein ANO11243_068530 [Dothideomycetidae sp. 11243]|nr:hypothetical protein ANO11243_068530 [fungal sp. No.11243]
MENNCRLLPHQDQRSKPLSTSTASGLRSAKSSSPPNVNRIAQYESAPLLSKSRRRPGGPAFDVIKNSGVETGSGSQLLDLPNEILIHALANLSPSDLTSISMASRRLHDLVTTQHAWRAAFSRYFPGPESLTLSLANEDYEADHVMLVASRRDFTRLTALASWRSEYILRTRLLRSLARGKPAQFAIQPPATRSAQSHTASPMMLYNSQLFTTINHIHASFGTGLNKRLPSFIHGADDVGMASVSDPSTGKVQNWGLADPAALHQFSDRFIGEAPYGLGSAQLVGIPNPMDVSTPHGMVCGEGLPGGNVYFRFTEEMRGRFLAVSSGMRALQLGIPKVIPTKESHCCVWIAKTTAIPSMTDGMIGIMSGSSLGVLSSYSLGSLSARDQRHTRGELTARWVICPGVPIITIAVDEDYSYNRLGQNRIWVTILNALGEVYYLTKFPKRHADFAASRRSDVTEWEQCAWQSGRSVYWRLIEPTRRQARPDPYNELPVDGSYTPRSSWTGMCLSKEQIAAETHEIESFLGKKPADFQAVCFGWDMRRKLEVDFANDDGNHTGETIVVVNTGLNEGTSGSLTRFTRIRPVQDSPAGNLSTLPLLSDDIQDKTPRASLFGGPVIEKSALHPKSPGAEELSYSRGSQDGAKDVFSSDQVSIEEEWRMSDLTFGGLKGVQITASCLDQSTFAIATAQEDPFLAFSGASSASSPSLTPMSADDGALKSQDVPGQRARLLAIGTSLGTIMIFNVRASISSKASLSTHIEPLRIIHTDSPAISCLGLSSLYLVSGGTDGLVQAWDPLASSTTPVRTLHSRFSSRARRRLAQAAASPQGVGINLFAAGAIALDPDPTALRGLVSLGTHLLYWHFSSSAADAYRSHKRRLRRSERMSNGGGGERYAPTPRAGGVKRFIASEQWELQVEEHREKKETARMAGRFGTDLLGESATEDDMLAYAALLSQEAFETDQERRRSVTPESAPKAESSTLLSASGDTSSARRSSVPDNGDHYDADLEEAIKQSLALSGAGDMGEEHVGIPIKYAKSKRRSPKNSPRPFDYDPAKGMAGGSGSREKDELEFALQISLAEEQSRRDVSKEWPSVGQLPSNQEGKGKGRAREE